MCINDYSLSVEGTREGMRVTCVLHCSGRPIEHHSGCDSERLTCSALRLTPGRVCPSGFPDSGWKLGEGMEAAFFELLLL